MGKYKKYKICPSRTDLAVESSGSPQPDQSGRDRFYTFYTSPCVFILFVFTFCILVYTLPWLFKHIDQQCWDASRGFIFLVRNVWLSQVFLYFLTRMFGCLVRFYTFFAISLDVKIIVCFLYRQPQSNTGQDWFV